MEEDAVCQFMKRVGSWAAGAALFPLYVAVCSATPPIYNWFMMGTGAFIADYYCTKGFSEQDKKRFIDGLSQPINHPRNNPPHPQWRPNYDCRGNVSYHTWSRY